MDFVLQLESVADKDDKTEIERLWEKQLNRITVMKGAQIDSKETDSEDEDDDSHDTVIKNKDEIEKMLKNLMKGETIISNIVTKKRQKLYVIGVMNFKMKNLNSLRIKRI